MTGLFLVNGLPGSGKSTLACDLAAALGLPLFSKDAYKGERPRVQTVETAGPGL